MIEQLMNGQWVGEYITFDELGILRGQRTNRWQVGTRKDVPQTLGLICWSATWRKYAFYPEPKCVFEGACLRDIARFVEDRTREHKAKQRR